MRVQDASFNNNRGRRISARLYRGGSTGTGMIFSHGLFANKDGYKITRLAESIVSAGADLLTFDFSYAGGSGGSISEISLLQEVEDLASAVQFFKGQGVKRIHLMGSSLGAAVTLLYAARQDEAVSSLILIATPVDIHRLLITSAGIQNPNDLPEDGYTPLEGVPIRNGFYREVASIDVPAAIQKISVPVLAIHGMCDAVVDPTNVGLLKEYLRRPIRTVFIAEGDHSLTRDSDIRLMAEEIAGWILGRYADITRKS